MTVAATRHHDRRPGPVALQLWTVRDALAANADVALAGVRAAGFTAVELGPLPPGLSPDRLAESLVRHGLTVVSVHCDLPTPVTVASIAGLARAVRCSKIIWSGWPRDPRFDSPAGVRAVIADCNAAGALARGLGLTFGVHNHWWEFEPRDGERPVRRLHADLRADIFWQLDVYWAQTAGEDPAAVLSELGPRLRSIHWKDGPCVHGQPMTAVGRGAVDVPAVLKAFRHPVDWIVELDVCAGDPLAAAAESLDFLEAQP